MATLGTDSFAFYDDTISAAELARRWDVVSGAFTRVAGPFGDDYALRNSSTNYYIERQFPGVGTLWFAGYQYHENGSWGTLDELVTFWEGTTKHITVMLDQAGHILVKRGNENGTLLATSTETMPVQTWQHVQVEVTIDDAAGVVNIWIDDVQFINLTGADTDNAGAVGECTGFRPEATGFGASRWAHIAYWDTTGDAPTGQIAQHRVDASWPESDASVQFTPQGAGTNNVEVDETVLDDDTTYNESSTVGHKDRFNMYSPPPTLATIYAVTAVAVARMDDAGPRSIQVGVYSGTTEDKAASAPLAQAYKHFEHMMTLNPDDSAAWQQADIDALQAQYEVSA